MSNFRIIREILTLYPKETVGNMQNSFPVESGLIHRTFKIETDLGIFCLQRLHPKLSEEEIISDYREVLNFLAEKSFPAPRLVLGKKGETAVKGKDGRLWRLTTWLPGKSMEKPQEIRQIHSAASFLGRFHSIFLDFNYRFRSKHPLHDTKLHLERLQNALEKRTNSEWWPKVSTLGKEILEKIEDYYLPEELPRRVVHGDPKISNFLFDENGKAIALIDLDTCNRHFTLVDLGDAIRSWCSICSGEKCYLSEERFKAFIEGYSRSRFPLSEIELEYIPTAAGLISLELSARFATDTLEDSYFGWDSSRFPSRPHHNFYRALQMINLWKNINKKLENLKKIISNVNNGRY